MSQSLGSAGWTLADWSSVASFVSLIGLVPLLYNASLQLNDRRRARRARMIRASGARSWHLIRPNYGDRMARVEDVMACQEVFAKLTNMGYKVTVGGDDERLGRGSNLVLVCGPKSNKVSARLVQEVNLPFEVVPDGSGWAFIDRRTHQIYRSPLDENHQGDVAIFGRVTNQAGATCYLLWGLHGEGTVIAARAFTNDRFLDEVWQRTEGRDFVGVLYAGFTSLDDIDLVRWLAEPRNM
jgi:hypothetical protein